MGKLFVRYYGCLDQLKLQPMESFGPAVAGRVKMGLFFIIPVINIFGYHKTLLYLREFEISYCKRLIYQLCFQCDDTLLFAIAEIREVKYGDRSGIYWLGSYPFPLAKRDVSFITVEQRLCLI